MHSVQMYFHCSSNLNSNCYISLSIRETFLYCLHIFFPDQLLFWAAGEKKEKVDERDQWGSKWRWIAVWCSLFSLHNWWKCSAHLSIANYCPFCAEKNLKKETVMWFFCVADRNLYLLAHSIVLIVVSTFHSRIARPSHPVCLFSPFQGAKPSGLFHFHIARYFRE